MRAEACRLAAAALLAVSLAGCSGSSGSAGSTTCAAGCNTATALLSEDDVRRVVAQAAGEASARDARATIAVVDRVGNVLAVFRMAGARERFDLVSGRG
ncbi:MAG TPA: heme-binding protein, partial [Usitatibacteraceae bacterium]|nr:heme-binding protein [Usitatibacteraceae bacterium]